MATVEDKIRTIARESVGNLMTYLSARADNPESVSWDTTIRDIIWLDQKPDSLATWVQDHDGQTVETLQASTDALRHFVTRVWTPGPRRIEAKPNKVAHHGYVLFWTDIEEDRGAWSRRDFGKSRPLRSSESTWIGFDYSMHQIIVYRVVTP